MWKHLTALAAHTHPPTHTHCLGKFRNVLVCVGVGVMVISIIFHRRPSSPNPTKSQLGYLLFCKIKLGTLATKSNLNLKLHLRVKWFSNFGRFIQYFPMNIYSNIKFHLIYKQLNIVDIKILSMKGF